MAQVAHLMPAMHFPPTPHVIMDGAGLGAQHLSPDMIEDFAQRIAVATKGSSMSIQGIDDIFASIPNREDQDAVALRAIQLGGNATSINRSLKWGRDMQRGKPSGGIYISPRIRLIWGILSTVSMAASAYHGYKRNRSVGWALAWGAAGAFFPVITPTIALAQGFGKRK